jgi:hypothetical protein
MPSIKAILRILSHQAGSFCFSVLIVLVSCIEEHEQHVLDYPTVVTKDAKVSTEGVTFEAELLYFRGDVLEKGFIWSSKGSPTLTDQRVVVEGVDRKFQATIKSGLAIAETYYMRAYAKTNTHTVYGDSIGFVSKGGAAPVIGDFSPKFGSIGSEITVTGQNLDYEPDAIKVRIGDIDMVVKSVNETEIVFKIPQVNKAAKAPITIEAPQLQVSSSAEFDLYYPWTLRADWSAASPVASFADGDLAHFIWPNSNVMTVFNPITLQWLPAITMPAAASATTLATYSNGIAYIVFDTRIFRFNMETNTWNEFAAYPSRTDDDFIFVMGNDLYAGSFESGTLSAMNMLTNTWVEKKGLKLYSSVGTNSGIVVQNKTFFGIGSRLYSYDAASNSWTSHGEFGGQDSYALFAIGDEVFMGQGKLHYSDGNDYVYNYFYSYNAVTGQKKQYQKAPVGMGVVASFAINNKGYLFAATGPNKTTYQKILEFDPTRN